jgi:hypothetical protein
MIKRIIPATGKIAEHGLAGQIDGYDKAGRQSLSWSGNSNGVARKHLLFPVISLVFCLVPLHGLAQHSVHGHHTVVALGAVVNFKELARREALSPLKPKRKFIPETERPGPWPIPPGVPIPPAPQQPALAPPSSPILPSPTATSSFAALGDNDTSIPPDTQGAVGPNNLMVTLNTQVRIQDRSGNEVSIVSLDSFWSSVCSGEAFDPRLSYDPFGSRWIFAAACNPELTTSSLLVGVSQSSDPSGSWKLYATTVDSTGTDWGDYPSMGFNKDWVVVDLNLFAISNNHFSTGQIYAFSKADLYAGLSSVGLTTFTDSQAFTDTPAATYDNTLDTEYLVQSWNGNASGNGFLRISSITGAVGSEVYTAQVVFVSTPNPWDPSPFNDVDFAPQMSSTHLIQNGDDRIINVVYRNGYLWAAQNAFLPAGGATRTAAQWWQLAPDGTIRQFGRVDDSTGTMFYAYPSIAVNANDDAVLGYSSFSANQFAGANYSIRLADDPLSTMRSDVVLKAGVATYYKTFSGTQNRWGDFSNTVVDPTNDLDIWTIQEYASSPNFGNGDNRWGTWWGKIGLKKRRGQLISQ